MGCKVNRYECDVMQRALREKGFSTSESLIAADLYVINTCAVTAEAERKSRQIITRVKKLNPAAEIVVTGCAAQKNPDFYIKNGINCICGVDGKEQLIAHIGENYVGNFDLSDKYSEWGGSPIPSRTRAYVKIQDGCNNFCSYCIIPYLRGRSRSRSIENTVEEIKTLANSTSEIVLTGVNLSAYGADRGESLAGLIRAIKDVDVRIRLGSFYVEGVTTELLDALFSLKHFCPQFHLSLQHGDDGVLKSMNRHYTAKDYLEKVALIRSYDPRAAITTDIIVGYPTETEVAFENLKAFVRTAAFSDIHVFPYSKRSGTVGAKLKELPPEILKTRKHELIEIGNDLHLRYLNTMIGVPQSVLFEDEAKGETPSGYSEYYVRVYAEGGAGVKTVMPTGVYCDGLKGEIIK